MSARPQAHPYSTPEVTAEQRGAPTRAPASSDAPPRRPLLVRVSDIFFVLRPGDVMYDEEYAFAADQFARHGIPMPYDPDEAGSGGAPRGAVAARGQS